MAMSQFMRRHVSQNRKRHVDGRYDLDLTYITNNIIAMGYPSDDVMQGFIRNQIHDVSNFLRENHQECYKVYNLCQESKYDFKHFANMVEHIPFEDHNPPCFRQIEQLCVSVDTWLKANTKNVAIIHCKAGKGRTGTMVSCYLLYSRLFTDPFEALDYFSEQRTKDGRGVTIPSQIRIVEYYADYLINGQPYTPRPLTLRLIEVVKVSETTDDFYNVLSFRVYRDRTAKIYSSKSAKVNSKKKSDNKFTFEVNEAACLTVAGDVKINFYTKNLNNKSRVFSISFNTFCLLQMRSFGQNTRSCCGLVDTSADGNVEWTLTRKDVDLVIKNSDIEFKVMFHFRISNEVVPEICATCGCTAEVLSSSEQDEPSPNTRGAAATAEASNTSPVTLNRALLNLNLDAEAPRVPLLESFSRSGAGQMPPLSSLSMRLNRKTGAQLRSIDHLDTPPSPLSSPNFLRNSDQNSSFDKNTSIPIHDLNHESASVTSKPMLNDTVEGAHSSQSTKQVILKANDKTRSPDFLKNIFISKKERKKIEQRSANMIRKTSSCE